MDPIILGDLTIAAALPSYSARRALTGAPRSAECVYATTAAAVGLCWQGQPALPVAYRPAEGAIVQYGSAVLDYLVDKRGVNHAAVLDEGIRLLGEIRESFLTQEDVDTAADPTSPRTEEAGTE